MDFEAIETAARRQILALAARAIEQRLNAVVASYPDPDSVRRQYLQSREAMAQLESAVLEDQALAWVQTQAQVVDKPSSFAELTGFSGS